MIPNNKLNSIKDIINTPYPEIEDDSELMDVCDYIEENFYLDLENEND